MFFFSSHLKIHIKKHIFYTKQNHEGHKHMLHLNHLLPLLCIKERKSICSCILVLLTHSYIISYLTHVYSPFCISRSMHKYAETRHLLYLFQSNIYLKEYDKYGSKGNLYIFRKSFWHICTAVKFCLANLTRNTRKFT